MNSNIFLPHLRPTLAVVVRARRLTMPVFDGGVGGSKRNASFEITGRGMSSPSTRRYAASLRGDGAGAIIDGSSIGPRSVGEIWKVIRTSPLQYATIPAVAAFLGLYTNWVGVKMLFYPIEYTGTEWYRSSPFVPYGFLGWQGVVPCKTEKMASRLVNIVTERLLSVEEAFGNMDPAILASLLQPLVEDEIRRETRGELILTCLRPLLPYILTRIVTNLQMEIGSILDLRTVVLEAFVRDKGVLVELFQKVGRVELDFLVESGLGFGFILGLGQMIAWAMKPKPWTLPVAGAIVGYVTNWIAIKLLFDPAEPIHIARGIKVQGLFESRQVEVSDEVSPLYGFFFFDFDFDSCCRAARLHCFFLAPGKLKFGTFMAMRVLNSGRLLESLARDANDGELYAFLRRQLPYPVPEFILAAAVRAIGNAAKNQTENPELHQYMTKMLDVDKTLALRLKLLSPTEFEDLLHPVFQEDELKLIGAGGMLGAMAGLGQTRLGWGGPGATVKAIITLVVVTVSSLGYFLFKEVIEVPNEVILLEETVVVQPVNIRRRNTLLHEHSGITKRK
ncbi:hypothetical protein ACHAXA_007096 [Cyclostephanos tholiformis]|uniref:Uncharacterized protein n=1 Tax=Cyclostephanos tholiformis TaxID=382380 RepID=A0ABD3RZ76_9STRA